MKKFYTDIYFKSNNENEFWLPLFIEAENKEEAERLFLTIKNGINQEYSFQKNTDILNILSDDYSSHLKEKAKNILNGSLIKLKVNVWEFVELQADESLSYNEHLEFVEYNGELTPKTVADRVEQYQFPVRLIRKNDLVDFNEFLAINVVGLK